MTRTIAASNALQIMNSQLFVHYEKSPQGRLPLCYYATVTRMQEGSPHKVYECFDMQDFILAAWHIVPAFKMNRMQIMLRRDYATYAYNRRGYGAMQLMHIVDIIHFMPSILILF